MGAVFAVNAGNNTVSMLSIDQDGVVTTLSTIASGGTKPISVAVSGDAVYVLNYGNISGDGRREHQRLQDQRQRSGRDSELDPSVERHR